MECTQCIVRVSDLKAPQIMSFYFREKPRISDRLRGKSGDEILEEIKQHFEEDTDSFFEPNMRSSRDPFERHTAFPRVSFSLFFQKLLHNSIIF